MDAETDSDQGTKQSDISRNCPTRRKPSKRKGVPFGPPPQPPPFKRGKHGAFVIKEVPIDKDQHAPHYV